MVIETIAIAIGSFVFNIITKIYDYKKGSKKPQLVIDRDRHINPTLFHSFLKDDNSPIELKEGRGYKIPYVSSRVPIKNIGEIAADDCHGHIVKNGRKERVAWTIPKDSAAISIHPKSSEELDFCAKLSPYAEDFNIYNDSSYDIAELQNLYDELGIPNIIAPTEDGFKSPPSTNRVISSGQYEMLVTAKNSQPLSVTVNIV